MIKIKLVTFPLNKEPVGTQFQTQPQNDTKHNICDQQIIFYLWYGLIVCWEDEGGNDWGHFEAHDINRRAVTMEIG